MSTVTITLTLDMPDGVELVDVQTTTESTLQTAARDPEPSQVESRVDRRISTAPHEHHQVLRSFAGRLQEALGCVVEVPDGKRVDYVNVYGPTGRRRRVASFMVRESAQTRGPRVEIYCNPRHAETHPPAEPDLHNGRPVQVKVYLGDVGALDAAIALVTLAIDEGR